jgi:hypothetical protein
VINPEGTSDRRIPTGGQSFPIHAAIKTQNEAEINQAGGSGLVVRVKSRKDLRGSVWFYPKLNGRSYKEVHKGSDGIRLSMMEFGRTAAQMRWEPGLG